MDQETNVKKAEVIAAIMLDVDNKAKYLAKKVTSFSEYQEKLTELLSEIYDTHIIQHVE